MRVLVEKTYSFNTAKLTIVVNDFPLREARICVSGGTLGVEEIQDLLNDLNYALNFIATDENPWENPYE
jgi:hypothetical protein